MIVYISIGNSDDKLSQQEWASFWAHVDTLIMSHAGAVHGTWLSTPNYPYQNACWCIELEPDHLYVRKDGREDTSLRLLQDGLRDLARDFRQDSISWAEASETRFLKPTLVEDDSLTATTPPGLTASSPVGDHPAAPTPPTTCGRCFPRDRCYCRDE